MKKIQVTLQRSKIGATTRQKKNLIALGLNKLQSSNQLMATPQVLGIVNKVKHLITIQELN